MVREEVHRIPVSKIPQSVTECFHSALNLWQCGEYVREKGELHIAVGLWILGLQELGKYVLLKEAAANSDSKGVLEIPVSRFRSHSIKSEKGLALFKSWGIDLGAVGIPLTEKTRLGLWYVDWSDETQEFKRDFSPLDPSPIPRVESLGELVRRGIVKMQELERTLREPLRG